MAESVIRRKSKSYTATLATSAADVVAIPMADMAGGIVSVGTMSTNATAINVYAGSEVDGTFVPLHDYAGSAAQVELNPSSTEGRAYSLPDAAFGCHFIKLVGATTNSTGVTCTVTLKG